jgi:hypothetical protein
MRSICTRDEIRKHAAGSNARINGCEHGDGIALGSLRIESQHETLKSQTTKTHRYNMQLLSACLVQHPIDHDLLTSLGIHGFAKKRLDLLIVEALEVSATQKCVMGGNGA